MINRLTIDGVSEFSGWLLDESGGESGGERESGEPEDVGLSLVGPFVELSTSKHEVVHPGL